MVEDCVSISFCSCRSQSQLVSVPSVTLLTIFSQTFIMSPANQTYKACIKVNYKYPINSKLNVNIGRSPSGGANVKFIPVDFDDFFSQVFVMEFSELVEICDAYKDMFNTEFGIYTPQYKIETTKIGDDYHFKKTYSKINKGPHMVLPAIDMLGLKAILPILITTERHITRNLQPAIASVVSYIANDYMKQKRASNNYDTFSYQLYMTDVSESELLVNVLSNTNVAQKIPFNHVGRLIRYVLLYAIPEVSRCVQKIVDTGRY
jgi:hypothetical protein